LCKALSSTPGTAKKKNKKIRNKGNKLKSHIGLKKKKKNKKTKKKEKKMQTLTIPS
jgi:hypothetical protein